MPVKYQQHKPVKYQQHMPVKYQQHMPVKYQQHMPVKYQQHSTSRFVAMHKIGMMRALFGFRSQYFFAHTQESERVLTTTNISSVFFTGQYPYDINKCCNILIKLYPQAPGYG